MMGIKAPIQDILSQLASIAVTGTDNNAMTLHTRIWNNQLQYEKEGKLYDYPKPAAFLETMTDVRYEQIGYQVNEMPIVFRIHIIHEYYDAQDGTFEQDLVVFDIRDSVIRLLKGYRPSGCNELIHVTEMQDFDHDNLYHYMIDFTTSFQETTGTVFDTQKTPHYIEKDPPTDGQITVTFKQ